ncbi:MAG TPA: TonB-dependent receptor, partial [Thermoanaerobaculia bacterium]|nr:TonB-dependent receptor [Thermoanaerobaculia bacterium]
MKLLHRRIALAIFATLLLVSVIPAFAQSSGSSLTGRVVDESGAALPGVTITATNTATGFNRAAVTESDGSYRFPSLPIGTYVVTAELNGFSTVKTSNVQMQVATERNLPINMKQAAISQEITVTAEAPLVATTPAIGTVVSQQELEGLPLNGRQFANLATLAPGTTLSVNADPTKPGQLTIALNGGSGRNVNFVIDGGDNTDDTIGGALQNFNLEAVQEFKIQTMQYKAEYGRSSGGVLSVVTKTGTNDFQGSLYEFARRDNFYTSKTTTEIQTGASKQPYKRDQYGGSIGGPIIKDRAHFFATYEKTKRDTSYTVATGGVFPAFDGKSFPTPFQDELGTAKASVNLSPKQFLSVRYGYQKNAEKYGAVPLYLPSSLGTTNNKYRSILGNHTWQLGSNALNEFVYQWTKFNNAITADSNDPSLVFPSGSTAGQNGNTPQTTNQEKSQFKDDISWTSSLLGSHHELKTGVNYVHEPILGGTFTAGTSGIFTLLNDDFNSPVSEISIFGGNFSNTTPIDEYSVYLQDDWSATPRLTANVGMRYDLWTGFDLDQRTNPAYQDFAAAADSHKFDYLPWITPFANGKSAKGKNDKNNFAPRLGLTYDLSGTGRRLIRGGIGRYYDFPYTNATILFPAAAVQSNYGVIYNFVDATG